MKTLKYFIIGFVIFAVAQNTLFAQQYYYGVMAGMPTGVLGGLELTDVSYEVNLGDSGSGFTMCASKLYNEPIHKMGIWKWEIPLYCGWGARFTNKHDPVFGIRGICYGSYLYKQGKIEIVLQIAPMFRLMPSYGANLDVSVGVRFR